MHSPLTRSNTLAVRHARLNPLNSVVMSCSRFAKNIRLSILLWALSYSSVANALTVLDDRVMSLFSDVAASPNGDFIAWSEYSGIGNHGLHITDLRSKTDSLIVSDVDGWGVGFYGLENLAFSPDGKRVMFIICPPNGSHCNGSRLYTVRTDGRDLTQIANSSSSYDRTTATDNDIREAIYSPDGKKVLLQIESIGERRYGENGEVTDMKSASYIGMVGAETSKQTVKRIQTGSPLFWSADGTAIFLPGIRRLDLNTLELSPISGTAKVRHIVGSLPGKDDGAFVLMELSKTGGGCQPKGCKLDVISLDGKAPDIRWRTATDSIPVRDSENRELIHITPVGDDLLLLKYKRDSIKKPLHFQLVRILH
jgi:hypothetical protein